MKNSARQFALDNNLSTYISEKACKRGHFAPRRVKDSACTECEQLRKSSAYYEKYKTDENAFRKQFSDLRNRAKKNNIPFSIIFEDIEKPEYCPILGIKLHYGINHYSDELKWRKNPNKASFDKLDPLLGYVPGNVFVISLRANRLKNNSTIGEIENILAYMKRNK